MTPTIMPGRLWLRLAMAIMLVPLVPCHVSASQADPVIRVVSGVTAEGEATGLWLDILRRRLPLEEYEAFAPVRKPLTEHERAWAELIRSRVQAWEREIPALAELIAPIAPPSEVFVVIGNRGTSDAFTYNPTTMGFDLAALQVAYGDADLVENGDRIDRFFRHEYVHLLQKAWLEAHPWVDGSPLRRALAEIWSEGLGNYQSLSDRWKNQDGKRSATASRALAELEPRLVARLSAIACASPEAAAPLTADLSWGRFDRKWGALPPALWLQAERAESAGAIRDFFVAGPDAVWDLADRHLPPDLGAALKEVRGIESLCSGRAP